MIFGTAIRKYGAGPVRRPGVGAFAAIFSLLVVLAGCSGPDTTPVELRHVPGAAAQGIVTYYLDKYAAEFQLAPRPAGSPQQYRWGGRPRRRKAGPERYFWTADRPL